MQSKLFKKATIAGLIITAMSYTVVQAQCHNCTDPAPYTGQQVCGLPLPGLAQPSAACLSASACSGTPFSYTISFSGGVKAYYINITGGNVISRYISGGVPQAYLEYSCNPANSHPEFFFVTGGNDINSVILSIRWTVSSNNYIEVYGYTGAVGATTASVAFYGCFAITAPGAVPATPATIGGSSPVCYGNPKGWLLGCQGSPGATSYVWTGAVYATTPTVTGPFVAANQTINECVAARNVCGTSTPLCSTFYLPNICGGFRVRSLPKLFGDGRETGNEENFTSDITVYPNPASDKVSLYIKTEGRYAVELISLNGQVAKNMLLTGQVNGEIDVSRLPKGVYLLVIKQNNILYGKKTILIQ